MPTPDGVTTKPIGLDFTAVMVSGAARGVDLRMLSEVLPRVEAAIVSPRQSGDQQQEEGDGDE